MVIVLGGIVAIIATFVGFVIATACYGAAMNAKNNDLEAHEDNLLIVHRSMMDAGITKPQCLEAVNQMQNKGILFRNRRET